jgi:hypothetical protein
MKENRKMQFLQNKDFFFHIKWSRLANHLKKRLEKDG